VNRTYKTTGKNGEDEVVRILVPRFYCEKNHQKAKEGGEDKQYTITILPGFLIPYSRVRVESVHKAIGEYITNLSVNEIGAALLMNCLSSISLKKVFKAGKGADRELDTIAIYDY